MQQNTQSLDTRNDPRTTVRNFQTAVKKLYLNPVFFAFLAALFGFLVLALLSFFSPVKGITFSFDGMSDAMSKYTPWDKLALINVYAALAVAALVFLGFVVTLVNMINNRFGSQCKLGFYIMKLPIFCLNILVLLSVTLTGIKVVRDLTGLIGAAEKHTFLWFDLTKIAVFAIVLAVLVALYLAYLSYKMLMTVSIMKEAVCTSTPIASQYLFTAIGCLFIATVGIAAQAVCGFNLTLILGCASIALFGVFCIVFKRTMRRLEVDE